MAELADAPDLGSGVYDVQVRPLLPAPNRNNPNRLFPARDGFGLFFCKRKETFFRKGVINARNQTPETAVNNRFPVFRNGAAFAAKNYPIGYGAFPLFFL